MSQTSVEKAICSSCQTFAAGRTAYGGFVCEECIRIFFIQNQLWKLPPAERSTLILQEVLKNAL